MCVCFVVARALWFVFCLVCFCFVFVFVLWVSVLLCVVCCSVLFVLCCSVLRVLRCVSWFPCSRFVFALRFVLCFVLFVVFR